MSHGASPVPMASIHSRGTPDILLIAMAPLLPRFCVLSWLLLPIVVGCSTTHGRDDVRPGIGDEGLRVIATTSMLADLAVQIGGERVSVGGLMGPGVDPHLYKASAGDVTRLGQADLIFYNGLHLEGKMADVFDRMRHRGIPTFALAEESVSGEELLESDRFAGNYDPHVWFDVSLWKDVARRMADIFAEADPVHAHEYLDRLTRYLEALSDVHAYVQEQAARIPGDKRVIVTSHDAFGYFGRAYGFEVHGLQGISTATEAGTADVRRLADFVAGRRIPALFIETSVSPRGIEAVREAVRARGFDVSIGGTLYGDALGDPGTPAGTYLSMMRENIDVIVASLMGEPV